MAKETAAFLHDANARRDPKLRALRLAKGKAAVCDYWTVIEILREQDGCRYDLSWKFAWGPLASELEMPIEEVQNFIAELVEEFGLLRRDRKFIWSDSLCARVERYETAKEKRRSAARNAANVRHHGGSADAVRAQSERNATAEQPQYNPNINITTKETELQNEPEAERGGGASGVIEFAPRIWMTQAQRDSLAMNWWHGDEAKFKADLEAASDHLRHKGESTNDGFAYMRGWKRKGLRFDAGQLRAGPGQKSNHEKNLELIAAIEAEEGAE